MRHNGKESKSTKTHHHPRLAHQRSLPSSHHCSHEGGSSQTFTLDDTSIPVTADVTSVSGARMIKHRRTPGSSSDPYMPYKRVLHGDVIKDGGNDVIGRPPKTKMAKSKSEKGAVDFRNPKYASLAAYGKVPKRSNASREKGEKLIMSKLPKDDDRPLLGRRSRTFVVESRERLLDDGPHTLPSRSRTKEHHHHHHHSNLPSKYDTFTHKRPPKPPAPKDSQQTTSTKEYLPHRTPAQEDSTSQGTNQWQERREREETRISQWEMETETLREGARNPMNCGSGLPARPKSAGQLRYYDSDDSDESSLGGEIEIVDIDKELENDPEPSPYWSDAPPLQVPEVFIHTNVTPTSTPWRDKRNSRSGFHVDSRHHHHQQQQQQPHHQQSHYHQQQNPSYQHQQQQPSYQQQQSQPHQQQQQQQQQQQLQPTFSSKLDPSLLQQPPSSWSSRQRHDSGESDLSAFSDTLVKPTPLNGRRRFMSEPEILNLEDNRLGPRRHSKAKKGSQALVESEFRENDVIEPSASSLARASRERLYSDTMERVLSRYSEMGLRELNEDVSRKGANRPEYPSGTQPA